MNQSELIEYEDALSDVSTNLALEYFKVFSLIDVSLEEYDQSPEALAFQIAAFAHRNQKRENGETYFLHPLRCYDKYEELICETGNINLLIKLIYKKRQE